MLLREYRALDPISHDIYAFVVQFLPSLLIFEVRFCHCVGEGTILGSSKLLLKQWQWGGPYYMEGRHRSSESRPLPPENCRQGPGSGGLLGINLVAMK